MLMPNMMPSCPPCFSLRSLVSGVVSINLSPPCQSPCTPPHNVDIFTEAKVCSAQVNPTLTALPLSYPGAMDANGARGPGGADQHRRKRPREDARKPAVSHDATVKKRRDKYSSASDGTTSGHDDTVGHFQGRDGTSITDRCAWTVQALQRNLKHSLPPCRQNYQRKRCWHVWQSSTLPRQKIGH